MEYLPGEIKAGEFANGRSRLVVTNFRLYKELISWRKRAEFFSIPLEKLDGVEKHVLSNPALLVFGLIIAAAGVLLYTNSPDGSVGLLMLGGVLAITYFVTRKQGVAIYAGKSTIYFRGNDTQLEKIIQTVEKSRWERVNSLDTPRNGLAPTIPEARINDNDEESDEEKPPRIAPPN